MRQHIKTLAIVALVSGMVALGGCRRKDKPNVLALIPEDAPVVTFAPSPKDTLAATRAFLATFDGENLGDQAKALRYEWKKQYGVDPLDDKSLENVGLDLSAPWAMAYGKALESPLYFLAASDPSKVLEYFSGVMKSSWLIDAPKSLGKGVYVFAQPFGNTTIEVLALKLYDRAVALATGPKASAAIAQWPALDDHKNFQKAWKRAESDGSSSGAALRIVAKDSANVLPRLLADRIAKDAELRGALSIKEHRLELFFALLGAKDARPLFAEESGYAPGVGLPEKPVVVARSQVNASELYAIATGLQLVQPLLRHAGLDEARVAELLSLGSGAGALAIELTPDALKNAKASTTSEKLRALLDAFPITAVAELKQPEKFDQALVSLEKDLTKRGFSATLEKGVLKTASLSPTSQVSLSRRGSTLVYGIGPGAFSAVKDRVDKKLGLTRDHPTFGPLFEASTSGVIVDVSSLVTQASTLPQLLFGDQNALMKSFFGSTIKSFQHFQTAGATLGVEGPVHAPHPVLRFWLTTK